jgi:hypothetical protein
MLGMAIQSPFDFYLFRWLFPQKATATHSFAYFGFSRCWPIFRLKRHLAAVPLLAAPAIAFGIDYAYAATATSGVFVHLIILHGSRGYSPAST